MRLVGKDGTVNIIIVLAAAAFGGGDIFDLLVVVAVDGYSALNVGVFSVCFRTAAGIVEEAQEAGLDLGPERSDDSIDQEGAGHDPAMIGFVHKSSRQ